jgi:hypothetical protein
MAAGSSTPSPQVVEGLTTGPNSAQLWQPVQGPETTDLLSHLGLPTDGLAQLVTEATQVLSRCIPPDSVRSDKTGLVTGYVQSGKTMSFTTVAALARDNGFRIVIVIAGTSIPLSNQSKDRLLKDLRLPSRADRKWRHFHNPRPNPRTRTSIEDTLAEWTDSSVPEHERQTVLITVMKNHTHLNNLIQLLESMQLLAVPALIIDDEADQAGLNNQVNNAQESTTYSRLLGLRNSLPHHSFLQYTATPQAPLLINLIDALSPHFAEVLTPGGDYFGGNDFFVQHPQLVRTIPATDIPTANNQLYSPPESLIEAMELFVLGVAAGIILDEGRGNRSMMVHPSQTTAPHSQYHHWVVQILESWKNTLTQPDDSPDRQELLTEFQTAYDDLLTTVPNLPSFQELSERLLHALRRTSIHEVNARRGTTPQIPWRDTYAHVLVGGQAMDRGFTVEGLTVTYMPRGLGVGNADTVQQRARFFGYKRPYLGYCRVYLDALVRAAYQVYVEHEEDVRDRLAQHAQGGRPLREWKRAFFLDTALRPTRNSVLQLPYMQASISDDWYAPKVPHETQDAVQENRAIVGNFVAVLQWFQDSGHAQRTTPQRHHVAQTTLRAVYEDLLTKVRVVHPPDSQKYTGMLLQVGAYLATHSDAIATVYHMSAGVSREREINSENEVPQLFQGKNPRVGEVIYPGDRAIRADSGLTVQIHNLRILRPSDSGPQEEVVANVPTVAVWIPGEMTKDWLVQQRGEVG